MTLSNFGSQQRFQNARLSQNRSIVLLHDTGQVGVVSKVKAQLDV